MGVSFQDGEIDQSYRHRGQSEKNCDHWDDSQLSSFTHSHDCFWSSRHASGTIPFLLFFSWIASDASEVKSGHQQWDRKKKVCSKNLQHFLCKHNLWHSAIFWNSVGLQCIKMVLQHNVYTRSNPPSYHYRLRHAKRPIRKQPRKRKKKVQVSFTKTLILCTFFLFLHFFSFSSFFSISFFL